MAGRRGPLPPHYARLERKRLERITLHGRLRGADGGRFSVHEDPEKNGCTSRAPWPVPGPSVLIHSGGLHFPTSPTGPCELHLS